MSLDEWQWTTDGLSASRSFSSRDGSLSPRCLSETFFFFFYVIRERCSEHSEDEITGRRAVSTCSSLLFAVSTEGDRLRPTVCVCAVGRVFYTRSCGSDVRVGRRRYTLSRNGVWDVTVCVSARDPSAGRRTPKGCSAEWRRSSHVRPFVACPSGQTDGQTEGKHLFLYAGCTRVCGRRLMTKC
uniref:Uncharacterized protein n=1 Tax=Sipha flava TaxID=143950 RepID=A0A2S2Q1T6_9HEMI